MISGFILSFDIKSFIDSNCLLGDSIEFEASACFFPLSLIVFLCFSKAFPKGQ